MPHPRHALVIEGGGMKGAYASGVLAAFEEHGHHPFDAVYGTSAGGALGAWFSAGQARFAQRTWDYAADRRIVSYRRFARGGPLLDHEALLDIVYVQEAPIDQEAILRCRHPVVVTAVDIHTGETVYHDLREGDIIPWLKATGRLPFGAGTPVTIGSRTLLDGGIFDPIPVRKAVADGARKLTVVLNTPPNATARDSRIASALVARRYPPLRHGIINHHHIKEEAIAYASSPPLGVQATVIRPSKATGLSRLTRDLDKIRRTLEQGRADGAAHVARAD
ncbi:MAG: patatin family protein [Candidatus Thermoplasmatota archaeon]